MAAGRPLIAETVYPTIGATSIGRLIGSVMCSLPIRIGRMRLSAILFGLPLAPVAAAVYLAQKVIGVRYVVTNDSVDEVMGLSIAARESVSLCDVADATVEVRSGQAFFRSGDLHLIGKGGARMMTLSGIPRPDRVRAAILDVAHSRRQLADIQAIVSVRPSVDELKAIAAQEKAAQVKKTAAAKASDGE